MRRRLRSTALVRCMCPLDSMAPSIKLPPTGRCLLTQRAWAWRLESHSISTRTYTSAIGAGPSSRSLATGRFLFSRQSSRVFLHTIWRRVPKVICLSPDRRLPVSIQCTKSILTEQSRYFSVGSVGRRAWHLIAMAICMWRHLSRENAES